MWLEYDNIRHSVRVGEGSQRGEGVYWSSAQTGRGCVHSAETTCELEILEKSLSASGYTIRRNFTAQVTRGPGEKCYCINIMSRATQITGVRCNGVYCIMNLVRRKV